MKKLHLLAVVLVAAVFFVPSVASAVEYGGVGGRPAHPQANNPRTQSIFIYQLGHGQSAIDGVKIYNNTSKQQTIALNAVDSVLASGGAFSCAQNADPKDDVGAWIQLSSSSVTLAANSSQVVPFTVTAPASASVGEHDGCIAIQAQSASNTPSSRNGVVLSFRSAIRVVVTIPGKIVKKLTLASVNVNKATDGNYLVAPTAQNEGNVSLDTNVQAKLASLVGTSADKQVGGTYPVLPRSKASWNFEAKPPFWGGWYRARVTATYNSNPTALLGQNQGGSKTVALSSALFFVPPSVWADVVYALLLLAIAVAVAWLIRKQRDVRHIRKHWQTFEIEEGDTIVGLAKLHHTSWRKIARVNKLKQPYALRKNQKLKLPPLK